jgi:hypothetical protein
MSVFCHDQWRARISIPLSTSGTCRIGGWGIGPFPQEMSRILQVPWWKSGVTSHSKNWQIWCSPWGGDALRYLMQLVATPDTDCYFWFWPPLCSGTHSILLVTCPWNLFSLCLLLNLVILHTNIYTWNLLKINTVDSKRTFLILPSLFLPCQLGDSIQQPFDYWPISLTTRLPVRNAY